MPIHRCNLNIWYHLPQSVWAKVPQVYAQMPGWKGVGKNGFGEEGIPYWFGYDGDETTLCASVEPSGLLFTGYMDTEAFEEWIAAFKKNATEMLEFKVGDIELGEVDYETEWTNKLPEEAIKKPLTLRKRLTNILKRYI